MFRAFGFIINGEMINMARRTFCIVCGITLIVLGLFAVAGGLVPDHGSGMVITSHQAMPLPSPWPPTLGTFTLYPIITEWRFYLFIILFYIAFGLYVVYTSFIPRIKISLAVSFITAALGFVSAVFIYNKFITSYVYTNGNGAPALQSKDSVVKIIRLIVPNIIPYYAPAICALFAHILLVIFVAVGFVSLAFGRPKKRKTKYWFAGIIGGIVFVFALLSHLYVHFSYSLVYIFGYWSMSPVSYLPLSILFSLATSYGLFRVLSVSILRTRTKDAADTQG